MTAQIVRHRRVQSLPRHTPPARPARSLRQCPRSRVGSWGPLPHSRAKGQPRCCGGPQVLLLVVEGGTTYPQGRAVGPTFLVGRLTRGAITAHHDSSSSANDEVEEARP